MFPFGFFLVFLENFSFSLLNLVPVSSLVDFDAEIVVEKLILFFPPRYWKLKLQNTGREEYKVEVEIKRKTPLQLEALDSFYLGNHVFMSG